MHNGQQSACGAESDGGVSLFFVSTCVLKNKQWVDACWITLAVVHDLAAGHIRCIAVNARQFQCSAVRRAMWPSRRHTNTGLLGVTASIDLRVGNSAGDHRV
jgi:hypothetical protein